MMIKSVFEEQDVERTAKKLAKAIAGGASKKEVIGILCKSCTVLKGRGLVCELHKILTSES